MSLGRWALLTIVTSVTAAHAQAGTGARIDEFDKRVAPVLSTHCLSCHSGQEPKGGLDLSHRESALRGGESGEVVIPRNVDDSYLWNLVEAGDMPPEGALSPDELEVIRSWIADGAKWGTDPIDPFAFSTSRRAGYDWWSLQPLKAHAVPEVKNEPWCVNEIDYFVLATLQNLRIRPSPRADARTRVRRLYVDLIGLPAPVEVIEKFAADPSQPAWEELVQELLSSPHYGERWARHWMDIARFGESDGYEYNRPRDNFWHYRDWLIRAFNADMPYDKFARMQLAGDILKPNRLEGAAAVGFLVAGTHNTVLGASPTMKLAARHDELEELAGTVGQTFLGMTINCARCHDHKFDPISAREYYSFIAALDGVQHGEREFPSPSGVSRQRQQITGRRDDAEERLVERILARNGEVSKTANILASNQPLPANTKGGTYRVSLKIAPSVWAAANQATSPRDGIVISLLKEDGSTLATKSFRPGAWNAGMNATKYQPQQFEYTGDGDGKVRLHLRPFPINSGRFGGAVDEISVLDVQSGDTVFQEGFDDLHHANSPGIQTHTGHRVYFGATSNRWEHSGTNAIHAVEYAEGNFALQLFGGNGGVQDVTVETPEEQNLLDEFVSLETQLAGLPSSGIYTVAARDPGVMHLYERGDVTRPGEEVVPEGLSSIQTVSASFGLDQSAPDAQRRVRLANWMTHRDNALFCRVIVNRIWHYHFGRGFVTSPSDFGFNGGHPSHPLLLDWLSLWFRDHGYSIKKLHRLIVTSATYQQSSDSRPGAAKIDQTNRFLWRQDARRLEAEVLRDSILEVAGQLNPQHFGPGYRDVEVVEVPPAYYYSPNDPVGKEFNRRTIYRWNVRGQRSALLDTFDCPDPSTKTPTRMVTTTPSQALSQWNDSFVTRMSVHLAERIHSEAGSDLGQQVALAWRHVLRRRPETWEREEARKLVQEHGLPLLCRVLFNSNEFILID